MDTKKVLRKRLIAPIAAVIFILAVCFAVGAMVLPVSAETGSETAVAVTAADETTEEVASEELTVAEDSTSMRALAAGLAIGIAALAGAISMGIAIAKASDGIARQPEADGKIRSALMIGLVFIETLVIYALIVSILIIFVM